MLPALDSLDAAIEQQDVLAVFNHSSEVLLGFGKASVHPFAWKMPQDLLFFCPPPPKKQVMICEGHAGYGSIFVLVEFNDPGC